MNEDLRTALKEQLNVDASKDFSKGRSNGSAAVTGERLPQKGALQRGTEALTAEEYVARTLPLLELEREAEVAQVRRSLLRRAVPLGSIYSHTWALACASLAVLMDGKETLSSCKLIGTASALLPHPYRVT